MADNWSASPITVTNFGDWAKWSFTIGSGDATNLNNVASDISNFIALRHAMSAPERFGVCQLMINDTVGIQDSPDVAFSSADWVSAFRFRIGAFLRTVTAGAIPVPSAGATIPVYPWVTGSNTIRLVWYGREGDAFSEPCEIDFVAVQSGSAPYIDTVWPSGDDDTDDTKPVTTFAHVGYDAHTNPDAIELPSGCATWVLEGSSATTGTAQLSVLEVVKFCPPTATVRVTGAGDPISGLAGVFNNTTAAIDIQSLDGNGEATFTIDEGNNVDFWFGGSDDWLTSAAHILAAERIGCGGWHVGYVAIGA